MGIHYIKEYFIVGHSTYYIRELGPGDMCVEEELEGSKTYIRSYKLLGVIHKPCGQGRGPGGGLHQMVHKGEGGKNVLK